MTTCPPEWATWIKAHNAGFFHSPSGLLTGAPAGDPLYCVQTGADGVEAMAVGVRHACRLSRRTRHVYFPSVPAVRDAARGAALLESLVARLRAAGAAEVIVDSFDATWCPPMPPDVQTGWREEFVISLEATPEDMLARCSTHHRRHIRKGDRSGWTLRTHTGAAAGTIFHRVQSGARERADERGTPFAASAIQGLVEAAPDLNAPWGATLFGAWEGEVLLAAMMVGWGGRRAYYIAGGATPPGYTAGASAWLHWRIATTLASAGFLKYNLGGAASDASSNGGLKRFKQGFGAPGADTCGARWQLRSMHLRGHEVLHGRLGMRHR